MCQSEGSTDVKRSVEQETEPLTWMFWRKRRYIVVMMVHLGYIANYSMRVNLSVAIVEMTKNRKVQYDGETTVNEPYFDWNSQQRGLILSSFYWGYIFTQLIGGFLAKRFGGNLIFGLGIGLTAILTLLIPWLGRTVTGIITIRVLQGVTFPCIHDIWMFWAPVSERSRMASIGVAGMLVGNVISMPISAFLAVSLGWESIFYVFGLILFLTRCAAYFILALFTFSEFKNAMCLACLEIRSTVFYILIKGALGVVWHLSWIIVVKTTPAQDRFISTDELNYIQSNAIVADENTQIIPWKSILTSKPVYAITAAHITDNWGFYTLLTQMPSFLSDTLNYNLESSGLLSAAPYLVMSISIPVAGVLADVLQNKGLLTTTQVRKYFNCSAFAVQMVCMLMAGFLVHPVWSVLFIIVGVGIGGFTLASYSINPLDIAPIYATIILGFSNTFATLPGIISPTLTGFLVKNQTVEEWRTVFYIAASIYSFGIVVYWFWCSGEVQPWAKKGNISPEAEKENKLSEECRKQ